MDKFDASNTYTSFEEHLHKAKTPQQRAHLDTVIYHSRGEVHANLDMVMPTLCSDPNYHEYGVLGNSTVDTGPKGLAAVKANYTEMVENGSYVIDSRKTRVVMSDNEVVTEGTYRQIFTAPVAERMGFLGPDVPKASHYMLSGRTVVFWEFDDDGKALGEDRYVFRQEIVPLGPDDLPDDYPGQFAIPDRAADGARQVSALTSDW